MHRVELLFRASLVPITSLVKVIRFFTRAQRLGEIPFWYFGALRFHASVQEKLAAFCIAIPFEIEVYFPMLMVV